MRGSVQARALIDENLSVKAHAKAMVEFNANQYMAYDYIGVYNGLSTATYSESLGVITGASGVTKYTPRVSVTQDTGSDIPILTLVDEEDIYFPELFPLESIFNPLRPSPGIVKLAADTRYVPGNNNYYGPHVPTKTNANRFYPASKKSPFKYWRAGKKWTSGSYTLSSPFIHYTRDFWINSIAVSVQNYSALPAIYNVQYLPAGSSTWTTAWSSVSNGAFPSDGTLQIYFYNNTWSTTQKLVDDLSITPENSIPRAVKIRGLRLQVDSMTISGSTLEVVELSPRLAVDLTDRLVSYSINSQISEGDSPLPVGSVSAASGTIELMDEDGLLDFDQSGSVLYGYDGRAANTQISARLFGTSLAGGEEDVRIAYSRVAEWSEDEMQNVSIKTIDDMSIFQTTKAPRAVWQGKTVTKIIRLLADWAGFSNIAFYASSPTAKEDPVVHMFIPDKNATVYDVIRDLAEAYQMSMFIDADNILRIYSKERIMNEANNVSTAFGLRYQAAGNGKPNIKEIDSITDGRPINDVVVEYEQKYINYGIASVYEGGKSANLNSKYAPLVEEVASVDAKIPSTALLWNCHGSDIASYSVTSGVATVITRRASALLPTHYILVDNLPPIRIGNVEYSLNGNYQVATTPNSTTVTFNAPGIPDCSATFSALLPYEKRGHIGNAVIYVDQDAGIGLPGTGYLVINGEVVYYEGMQYQYKVDGEASYTFHWITTEEGWIEAKNSIAEGSRFTFTGALLLKGRGKFGSECVTHYAYAGEGGTWLTHRLALPQWDPPAPGTYYAFGSGGATPLRYWDSGSTGAKRTSSQSMIRLAGISPDDALRLFPATQNTGRLNSLTMYETSRPDGEILQRAATSVRILGRNVKNGEGNFGPRGLEGIAGIFMDLHFGPTIGINGWFFEIELSSEVGPPERGGGTNVRLWQYTNSQRRMMGQAKTWSIQPDINWNNPAIGDSNFATMYDLEMVRVPTNPAELKGTYGVAWAADIIRCYINGELVIEYTEPQDDYWVRAQTAHTGVYVRGNTYADFDYFWAAGRRGQPYQEEESRANAEGSVSLEGAKEGGLIAASWMNNIWPRQFQKAAIMPSVPYIYDEFGPVCHGVKIIKQDFGAPVFNPKIVDGRLGKKVSYFVAAQTATPHDFEGIVVNASRRYNGNDDAVKVVGTKIHGTKLKYTLDDYLEENMKNPGLQTSIQTMAKNSVARFGPLPMTISSSYIQSRATARSLLAWIIKHSALDCDLVSLEVFGNPLIEPGDICTIDLTPLEENGYNGTQKFVVIEAKHSYSIGFETSLELRRIS